MNKRQSIPFLILLVAFLLWLYLKPDSIVQEEPKYQLNYIVYNASSTHFNEQGDVEYKISATKTTGLSEEDITTFEAPKVLVYIKNKKNNTTSIWQVSSKTGILYNQNKLILSNDVWVKNLTKDQIIQTMTTEKLTMLLDNKELTSDQLVSWQGPQMQQQGIGLWASLISEEFIVKDKVKAVYFNENK